MALSYDYFKRVEKTYGLKFEDFLELWKKQLGRCLCCGVPLNLTSDGRKDWNALSVDHEHSSGNVRSLLCKRCNTIVGLAEEKTDLLTLVIRYLEKFKQLSP